MYNPVVQSTTLWSTPSHLHHAPESADDHQHAQTVRLESSILTFRSAGLNCWKVNVPRVVVLSVPENTAVRVRMNASNHACNDLSSCFQCGSAYASRK